MSSYYEYNKVARVALSEGAVAMSFYYLLLAEEYRTNLRNYLGKRSTPRQEETHRLWQQRGLFERTKANLRAVDAEYGYRQKKNDELPFHHGVIFDAIKYLEHCIEANKRSFSTISTRIPK